MSVELRHLRYVVAVADAGTFEKAAERLHMTQPPLSRQIREVERQLGVQLFHRRPTRLTEAGQVFVEAARRIVTDLDRAIERTRGAGKAVVRVGYTVTSSFAEMPSLFGAMRDHHPTVTLDAREAWDPELETALAAGDLDAVLGRCLEPLPGTGSVVLRREPFAVVVGPRHRLAGATSVRLADLRGESLQFFPRRFAPRYHDFVMGAIRGTGHEFEVWENPLPGLRTPNLNLRSRGFLLLPASIAEQLGDLACLPLDDRLPEVELRLHWRKPPSGAVTLLVGMARRLARVEGWTTGIRTS